MNVLNIPSIIGDVVEQAAFELGTDIQYKHGTWKHIMSRILAENGGTNPNERFPLVCLVQVFEERYRSDNDYAEVLLTLLICNISDPNWVSEDRYTNNFIPILYPIYKKLLEVLQTNQYVVGYNRVTFEHTKIDDLYLPEGDANKLPEVLDGLWLRDLRLRIDVTKCSSYPEVTSVLEFGTPILAPGFPIGIQEVSFDITFSDTDAFKDGSTFTIDISSATGVLTISTLDSNLTLSQVNNLTTVTIADASLIGSTLTFKAGGDLPPAAGLTIGQVTAMANLRPNWVNTANTSDSVTF